MTPLISYGRYLKMATLMLAGTASNGMVPTTALRPEIARTKPIPATTPLGRSGR